MSGSFYITTAIDYPNGAPHLGHAYEKLVSDMYARWYRFQGKEVFFLTGTDENGLKLEQAAATAGQETMEFVDKNVERFEKLCKDLKITHNDFIRTSSERHRHVVYSLWERLKEKGDVYFGTYNGHYCVACESFYTETQAPNLICPVHEQKLKYFEEQGYFFRLSRYQDWIIKHIEENPDFLYPHSARSEMLGRLKGDKLMDLSISRPNTGWGIPVPQDKDHVVYTWFDALINYLSATVYSDDHTKRPGKNWWPADVHVIGKDISWFHSVIWPVMLHAADYKLPKQVYVHGMVLGSDGRRMSKTLGNGVDPQECIAQYPVESFRYFLIKAIPSGQDGAFSIDEMIKIHNNDLANELGNLMSRAVKLTRKTLGDKLEIASQVDVQLDLLPAMSQAMDAREHNKAMAILWGGIRTLNTYLNEQEPWRCKEDTKKFHQIMYTTLSNLYMIVHLLEAFLPESCEKARKYIVKTDGTQNLENIHTSEYELFDQGTLFPRLEKRA